MSASLPDALSGLCDAHIHVVGSLARFPMVAGRTYTPGEAAVSTIQALGQPLGVTRFVVVQPSFYGTDNSLLLAAIAGSGRGVAVVDPATADAATLASMHAAGVRGLRINLYSTLAEQSPRPLAAEFTAMANVAARHNWHVEVIAPLAQLAEAAPLLAASPVPVVIDHYALHHGHAPHASPARAVLALMAHGHVWTKLSAPYRCASDPLATRPDPAWLSAILHATPRCVWGSDWPHTPAHAAQTGAGVKLAYRALDYATVLGDFRAALPSDRVARAILVDNPAQLYEF